MKKLISTLAMAAILATFTFTYNTQEAKAQGGADLSDGAGSSGCKWKRISCGWFSSYEACVNIGDGSSCICGKTTRPC